MFSPTLCLGMCHLFTLEPAVFTGSHLKAFGPANCGPYGGDHYAEGHAPQANLEHHSGDVVQKSVSWG